jgi:hypothetical protein
METSRSEEINIVLRTPVIHRKLSWNQARSSHKLDLFCMFLFSFLCHVVTQLRQLFGFC